LAVKASSFLCFHLSQDDSALNRKVIAKIIESEKTGRLKDARLLEADDGTTAVEMLRRELSEGRKIDFVLMDYVMVSVLHLINAAELSKGSKFWVVLVVCYSPSILMMSACTS
jgi:hypothetical protein